MSNLHRLSATASVLLLLLASSGRAADQALDDEWTSRFSATNDEFSPTGRNPFFVLEPGYVLEFEGEDERLTITVLDKT